MSQGLEVYNENGDITYSTGDISWNMVDKFIVLANETITKKYNYLDGYTLLVQIQMINDPPFHDEAWAPKVLIEDTTTGTDTKVTVRPRNNKTSDEVLVMVLAK